MREQLTGNAFLASIDEAKEMRLTYHKDEWRRVKYNDFHLSSYSDTKNKRKDIEFPFNILIYEHMSQINIHCSEENQVKTIRLRINIVLRK